MTTYLEDAAADLRKARDDNEHRDADTAHLQHTHPVRAEIRADRLRIAEGFLLAAAIEAGIPLCCHATPEPGQEAP